MLFTRRVPPPITVVPPLYGLFVVSVNVPLPPLIMAEPLPATIGFEAEISVLPVPLTARVLSSPRARVVPLTVKRLPELFVQA